MKHEAGVGVGVGVGRRRGGGLAIEMFSVFRLPLLFLGSLS